MDYSRKSKVLLDFLDTDPGSLKLFEELVLKGGVVTVDEFFGSKSRLRKKLLALDYQPEAVNRIISFIGFDKIKFEGRDLIFLDNKDKEMLYESFKEIREEFESHNFGKFNDRLYEEAMFWDEFFRRQLEEKSFLYGNAADDSVVRNSLPSFIKQVLDNLPKDAALDLNENLDDIKNNEFNDKHVAVGNVEQTPLISTINNRSLAILYRNVSNLQVSSNRFDTDEDFAEFRVVASNVNPTMQDGPQSTLQRPPNAPGQESARPNDLSAKKPADAQRLSLETAKPNVMDEAAFQEKFKSMLATVRRSVDSKVHEGQLSAFFGNSKNNDNMQFIDSLHTQIHRLEQGETFMKGKDGQFYNEDFTKKYQDFNERARHLLVILYSLFPISVSTDKEKVRNLMKSVGALREEMGHFKAELKNRMRVEEYEMHKYPIDFLDKLIAENTSKLKGVANVF